MTRDELIQTATEAFWKWSYGSDPITLGEAIVASLESQWQAVPTLQKALEDPDYGADIILQKALRHWSLAKMERLRDALIERTKPRAEDTHDQD
jgi:hypothetical protein